MIRLQNSSRPLPKMRLDRRSVSCAVLLATIASLCFVGFYERVADAQTRPITYPQLITALGSKIPNPTFKTKEQLITFLIADVKKRKVDKPLTQDREDDLRQAGATDELIEVIRANSPGIVSTPTATPTPTPRRSPTPIRTITPIPTPTRTATPTPLPTPAWPRQVRNAIGMEFLLIPPGTFLMGSPENEADRNPNEGPQHRVRIGYAFYMGRYEVTQAQWRAVMGTPHEGMRGLSSEFFGDNYPVVRLSWSDAKAFVDRLNSMDRQLRYRLPSEAEWEYAARGGTQDRFYWGDDPDYQQLCKYANVKDDSGCRDGYRRNGPVGSYQPNGYGLYDMTGNVWEWCEDIWHPEGYDDAPTDGSPNMTGGDGSRRTQRGGSWADPPGNARIAARGGDLPTDRNDEDGFRIVAIPR